MIATPGDQQISGNDYGKHPLSPVERAFHLCFPALGCPRYSTPTPKLSLPFWLQVLCPQNLLSFLQLEDPIQVKNRHLKVTGHSFFQSIKQSSTQNPFYCPVLKDASHSGHPVSSPTATGLQSRWGARRPLHTSRRLSLTTQRG